MHFCAALAHSVPSHLLCRQHSVNSSSRLVDRSHSVHHNNPITAPYLLKAAGLWRVWEIRALFSCAFVSVWPPAPPLPPIHQMMVRIRCSVSALKQSEGLVFML